MKSKLVHLYINISSLIIQRYMKYLKNVTFESGIFTIKGIPLIKNKGLFTIEDNVKINSKYSVNPIGGNLFCTFIVDKNAKLILKKGTRISNSTIYCKKEIIIGENVFIGGDTRIYDTDFHSLKLEKRIKEFDDDIKSASINIGDGVFIGASSIILKGVSIGENSIIGAGSVVTKNIPENQIWAGNPAKFIKKVQND
jgi:acetyltransferase-like isoleucine patch superfamily enzyme